MSSANQIDSDKAADSNPAERRRNLRFPLSATVEAVENSTGAMVTGRISDLGLGGCYVDTLNPFLVGTEAIVRIIREKESFEAQGKVVYSQMGMGMGIAFVSAQPEHVRLFQRWLLEISGQPDPAQQILAAGVPDSVSAQETQAKNAVLSDLILTLMQKKVLTEEEGKDLLGKLFL